jgi:hypothetical protein
VIAARARHAVTTLVVAAALLGASPATVSAQLFDLTGTWVGKLTCKSFDTGTKVKLVLEPVLQISQNGAEVGARLDFGGSQEQYHGLANPDGKKPETKGQLALLRCSTDGIVGNDFGSDEIGHFTVTTKAPPSAKAGLKGLSIYTAPGTANPEAGTCAWKWTRTELTNPNVPIGCPG